VWCLVKHKDNFTFYLFNELVYYHSEYVGCKCVIVVVIIIFMTLVFL